jgi:DNA-binding CsgD family transcriptional regulator
MQLTLTSDDIARLQAAMTACLTPFDHETPVHWGQAIIAASQTLLGADQGFLALPRAGEPDWVVFQDANGAAAARAYMADFAPLDYAVQVRRVELGLETYHLHQLYDREHLASDPVLNEWCRPYRLFDTVGMSFNAPGAGQLPALVHLYRDHPTADGFGDRGALLLQLLLPGFKAGAHAVREYWAYRDALGRLADTMEDGVVLVSASGQAVHRNVACQRLLAAESPDGRGRLEATIRRVSQAVLLLARGPGRAGIAPPSPSSDVASARARYRVSGVLLKAPAFAGDPIAAVSVVPLQPRALTDDELAGRYGLTPREREVARLLADGASTQAISRELGIASATARRHTERVLSKLHVHSRGEVRGRLVAY